MKDLQEIKPDATKEELFCVKYTVKDYSKQFTDIRQREPAEVYANLMYLSNQLAHVFTVRENGNKAYFDQMSFIRESFMKIKDWCIHKIIDEKRKGANIELVIDRKNTSFKYDSVLSVALPTYFEPFRVHIPNNLLSEEEINLCMDDSNKIWRQGLKTTFPSYISDEKAELLQKIYNEKYLKIKKGARVDTNSRERLKLFLGTRNRILKRKTIKGATTARNMQKKSKQVAIQKDNNILFKELAQQLNIQFPKYFKNGFLKRTSYSLGDVHGKIYELSKEILKKHGIKEENMDSEIAKLFIYMKVTEPLSSFMKLAEQERKDMVEQDAKLYIDGFEFITNNLSIETNYNTLRTKTKNLTASKGTAIKPDHNILTENAELIAEVQQLRIEVNRLTEELQDCRIKLANSRRLLNASRKDNRKLNKNNEQLRQENIRLKTQEASTKARTQRSGGKIQKSGKETQGDDENEK